MVYHDGDGHGRSREGKRGGGRVGGREGGRERERTDGSRGKKKSINLAPRNVAARARREENEKRNSLEA